MERLEDVPQAGTNDPEGINPSRWALLIVVALIALGVIGYFGGRLG